MNTQNSIEWIILITTDFPASRSFYSNILGLPMVRHIPEEEFIQYACGDSYLALYGKNFAQKLLPSLSLTRGGGAIYTWKETKDVDELYRELQEKGVSFLSPPVTQPWGQKTAYFTDPDGHIWEIQSWIHT